MSHRPEQYGMMPDGDVTVPATGKPLDVRGGSEDDATDVAKAEPEPEAEPDIA